MCAASPRDTAGRAMQPQRSTSASEKESIAWSGSAGHDPARKQDRVRSTKRLPKKRKKRSTEFILMGRCQSANSSIPVLATRNAGRPRKRQRQGASSRWDRLPDTGAMKDRSRWCRAGSKEERVPSSGGRVACKARRVMRALMIAATRSRNARKQPRHTSTEPSRGAPVERARTGREANTDSVVSMLSLRVPARVAAETTPQESARLCCAFVSRATAVQSDRPYRVVKRSR